MKNSTPYLTQYYNLKTEWQRNNIDVDNATEIQVNQIKELRIMALQQSGLSSNELDLIVRCRNYNTFKKVNVYSIKLSLF